MIWRVAAARSFFASPWRGEVASEGEGGEHVTVAWHPRHGRSPHPALLRCATLPLQGRVRCLRFVQPDFVVVKGRAAERRDRIGAGQAVDAAAVGVSRIGPERFGDYETFCFVVTA